MSTMSRIAEIIDMRRHDDKTKTSDLTPAYTESINGELKLLRHQLYSSGLFTNIETLELDGSSLAKKAKTTKPAKKSKKA